MRAPSGPDRAGAGADAPTSRPGRPPLTERRKEATRLEIAHEAVRLFAEHGVQRTSGEDIARAVGISTRTLWRYFPTKEQCVRPLLTRGLDRMARRLVELPPGRPLADVARRDRGAAHDEAYEPGQLQALRSLIRLTRNEPSIMAVWLQVHYRAEDVLAEVIATRLGLPADSLDVRVRATMVNSALRVAMEDWALSEAPDGEPGTPDQHDALGRAMGIVCAGLDC
ncbi:TetR/AcrR family transcriptional regulator [Streptomyces mexicanus]|uniref:TetR family transcriptional regulator n=1 Tax=Streptomyces mexicanus TaxID=178566 RepID=A0A7X1HXU3_9ACTN|nr:TetR/AcrR family transcriptional regulator [Streptomyces mexicanus]MBC2865022.1 TetR family transcriptional regulator [Streptomyces mexicanus]